MLEELENVLEDIKKGIDIAEYQKFKNGELELSLIGNCRSGIDEADYWKYWCHEGKLYLETYEERKEVDKKLIPAIFINPLFEKKERIPFSKIFEEWKKVQETGKFKIGINTKRYLFELKDDCVILYTRYEDGIREEELNELCMFSYFGHFPSDNFTMTKEEFMSLGPYKYIKRKSPKRNR